MIKNTAKPYIETFDFWVNIDNSTIPIDNTLYEMSFNVIVEGSRAFHSPNIITPLRLGIITVTTLKILIKTTPLPF